MYWDRVRDEPDKKAKTIDAVGIDPRCPTVERGLLNEAHVKYRRIFETGTDDLPPTVNAPQTLIQVKLGTVPKKIPDPRWGQGTSQDVAHRPHTAGEVPRGHAENGCELGEPKQTAFDALKSARPKNNILAEPDYTKRSRAIWNAPFDGKSRTDHRLTNAKAGRLSRLSYIRYAFEAWRNKMRARPPY